MEWALTYQTVSHNKNIVKQLQMVSNNSIIHSNKSSQHGRVVLYMKVSLICGVRCKVLIHLTELVSGHISREYALHLPKQLGGPTKLFSGVVVKLKIVCNMTKDTTWTPSC